MTSNSSTQTMQEALRQLENETLTALSELSEVSTLQELRVSVLGRKGSLTQILRSLKDVPAEERSAMGSIANRIQEGLNQAIDLKKQSLQASKWQAQITTEALDVTMPGRVRTPGVLHPLTLVTEEICDIFRLMGFHVIDDALCPEVETDYYNFEALNFPADHPARDMQDTFYTHVGPEVLLRSQTSNAQIRHMEAHQPPVQVVVSGRVYRNEEVSSRKNVLFHQLEGLWVDENVSMADLKGVLHRFVALFFGEERPTRFRSSYFPFTEPSAEMDVQCILCTGAGCRTCGHHGWLEILGAGMVDPNVLQGVKIDPEKYVGFAFGVGIERMAMLKYGIDNIRAFYTNDQRFLTQFRGLS